MNERSIDAVVFDLDGLIFDTEALFHRVTHEYLSERGKSFTREIMGAMMGRRAAEAGLALKTLAELDDPVETILDDVRARFFALMDAAVHPMPGLFALLAGLERHGIPRAVGTSSPRSYAEHLLKSHGLWSHFSFVLAAEDVVNGKPDPEIYRKSAQALGFPTSRVLVLEDSPPGIRAAKDAGAFAVGVPHEHSPAESLSAADLIVNRLDDPLLFDKLRIRS